MITDSLARRLIAAIATLALMGTQAVHAEPARARTQAIPMDTPCGRSLAVLQDELTRGRLTAEALTADCLDRIRRHDRKGVAVNSVLAINPTALGDARRLDAERRAGRIRGPLHGIPILVKDNIETADPVATTAGSLALKDNITERDAPVIARLRDAGAVILGKANLSEWANIRSTRSISGWSAAGGLTRNPYALDRNACGSSSGSAAATAAAFAVAAIGTETDGSITCPASVNGLVGIKPTVGLVSRTRIIPISSTQDTAGPLARSVTDAALLLTIMAGTDPADPATREADARRTDYLKVLAPDALRGKRIGVLGFLKGYHDGMDAAFSAGLERLKAAGATLVDIKSHDGTDRMGEAELTVLLYELKTGLNAYLATTPPAVRTRTLADIIAFNAATPAETVLFGQDLFELAQKTEGLEADEYREAAATARRLATTEGLDRMFASERLDAVIAPTGGPAWTTDIVNGDHFLGAASALPAIAGYPHVTVPMGEAQGLPVGMSFIGPAWSEARLIAMAYAFEKATQARRAPRFLRSVEEETRLRGAVAPR